MAHVVTFKSFQPVDNWLLCRVHKTEETESGLFIPEEARSELQPYLEVIASGPGTWNAHGFVENQAKPGEFYCCRPTATVQVVMVADEKMCIVRESDLTGKVEP